MAKSLHAKLLTLEPGLAAELTAFRSVDVKLQNDSDGKGDYIAVWSHKTISRPTKKQIDDTI